MQGRTLTNDIIVTDDKLRAFPFIFFVLAVFTHRGELKDTIARTNGGWTF